MPPTVGSSTTVTHRSQYPAAPSLRRHAIVRPPLVSRWPCTHPAGSVSRSGPTSRVVPPAGRPEEPDEPRVPAAPDGAGEGEVTGPPSLTGPGWPPWAVVPGCPPNARAPTH